MTESVADRDHLMSVLAYEHPGLVERLMAKLGLTAGQATELFSRVKHFLYDCTRAEAPLSPAPDVDEGWHNFILFTKDYAEFCTRYFGHFIHHEPVVGVAAAGGCWKPYCKGTCRGRCSGVVA
jgi:hypothetical protein